MNQKEKYNKKYFKRCSFSIGNKFDGIQIFEVFNEEKECKIVYDHYYTSRSGKEKIIKTKDFSSILNGLEKVHFEDWDDNYPNKIDDGIYWSFEAYFKPSIIFKKEGNNNFPKNIKVLIDFIKGFFPDFSIDTKIKTKLSEKDLLRRYCLEHRGTSFTEVSVGNRAIAKNSTDRRSDIVRIENDHYRWYSQYGTNKEYFDDLVRSKKPEYEIELVRN